MKTIYIKQALLALLCIAGTACTNEDYQLYDTTQKDSAFIEYINDKDEIATSVSYSFGFDIATEYVVELPVKLMGMTSDKARTFLLNRQKVLPCRKECIILLIRKLCLFQPMESRQK